MNGSNVTKYDNVLFPYYKGWKRRLIISFYNSMIMIMRQGQMRANDNDNDKGFS